MSKKPILMFLMCYLLCVNNLFASEDSWLEFLNDPTPETYSGLKTNRTAGDHNQSFLITDEILHKTIRLIEQRNEYAIDAAFLMMPRLDGGNLEEMFIAVGDVVLDKPDFVLEMFDKHKTPYFAKIGILRMVPEYVIDDYDKQLELITNRMDAINGVTQEHLGYQKKDSLEILSHAQVRIKQSLEKEKTRYLRSE